MKVWINDTKEGGRKMVEVELIKTNSTTIIVKLPSGNFISRKKNRDIVKE